MALSVYTRPRFLFPPFGGMIVNTLTRYRLQRRLTDENFYTPVLCSLKDYEFIIRKHHNKSIWTIFCSIQYNNKKNTVPPMSKILQSFQIKES